MQKRSGKITVPAWVIYLAVMVAGLFAAGIILWATWEIANARFGHDRSMAYVTLDKAAP